MSSFDHHDSSPLSPRIAVFGAGAVGCYYGARLALAGYPVTLIARPAHVRAMAERGLLFESAGVVRRVPVQASETPAAVADADVILVCVKSRDTAAAAREIARVARPDACIVSLQNGVDNARILREAGGLDAFAAVVYVAASMAGDGHVRHAGRGDLVLGEFGPPLPGRPRAAGRVDRLAAAFERAAVPCPVVADVRVALWEKLVMNCAFNAISALARSRYGAIVADARIASVMADLVHECVAVAQAQGVAISDAQRLHADALALGAAMAQATSSTAQDLALGRPTEIDALNGYVAQEAAQRGLAAPVNAALWAIVGLLERNLATAAS